MTHPPPTAADPRLTVLLADTTPISYQQIAQMIDREEQSLRTALSRRRRRVRETGAASESDIPEPSGYRAATTQDATAATTTRVRAADGTFAEPWWPRNAIVRWAMRNGKLAADGVTPLYYREANKQAKQRKAA